ncbi:hypothetical protein [Pseudodesulfovibrio sp.]|nr:hypothetical protein [Pseudodesulfovibrio sp.]MDD3311561.1 hypothetical protein [Pseudodesulfovibrio sp.]
MPNMDYPGPCLSCIADNCELWDQNLTESQDERNEGGEESR